MLLIINFKKFRKLFYNSQIIVPNLDIFLFLLSTDSILKFDLIEAMIGIPL